jgi:hypothetical protein
MLIARLTDSEGVTEGVACSGQVDSSGVWRTAAT